jgi:hypothetical protein
VQPDLASFRAFLDRVRRRLALKAIADGAAAGAVAAIGIAIVGWLTRRGAGATLLLSAAAIAGGTIAGLLLTARRRGGVAKFVEERAPASRNLILTAHELSAQTVDDYVPRLVLGRAARWVEQLDPAVLVPTRRSLAVVAALIATWLVAASRPALPIPTGFRDETGASSPAVNGVDVTITPPAYTGRRAETIHDPSRVTALAGSRLNVVVRSSGELVTIETLASRDTLAKQGSSFAGQLVADADGFIAIQARSAERASVRRLIGLAVVPDSLPHVRIAAPGRDERFPDTHRTLALNVESSDDIGLSSLTLRFTKVSGSGERFTFVDGQVPLTVSRRDHRTWTARAVWPLDSLELGPGDMVVYRAVASDLRGAAGTAESDSYIAEILAAGGVAAPGFAADLDQERYAVSQQMVIVKTERLIAQRATMSAADFADASQQIAAEQRKVRAEFVFMLGGELADAPDVAASMTDINEEEEAGRESDILAGYDANAGHVALIRGIRSMSRAASTLTNVDPAAALPHERAALAQLERAFSHSRILLRALATRERLDLSRRLSGSLADAATDARPAAEPRRDAAAIALRRVLSDVTALAGGVTRDASDVAAARSAALAEEALRIDPSAPALQEVSAELAKAASALAARHGDDAAAALDRAATGIVKVLRNELPDAPTDARNLGERRMNGALVDAARARTP